MEPFRQSLNVEDWLFWSYMNLNETNKCAECVYCTNLNTTGKLWVI